MTSQLFVRVLGVRLQRFLERLQFKWRIIWNVRFKHGLKTLEPNGAIVSATVRHNLKSLNQQNERMLHLIKPLSAIESVSHDSKILVIGPRNENDLFLLAKEGFRNSRGLDLISYSPFIDLGDMHKASHVYGESAFDVVLCGWTISYSSEPKKVAEQLVKVCRNGGLVGVGVEYAIDDPDLDAEWLKQDGYLLIDRTVLPARVNSVKDILALFDGNVGEVYFSHDAPLKKAHLPGKMIPRPSSVVAIFSITK